MVWDPQKPKNWPFIPTNGPHLGVLRHFRSPRNPLGLARKSSALFNPSDGKGGGFQGDLGLSTVGVQMAQGVYMRARCLKGKGTGRERGCQSISPLGKGKINPVADVL